MASKTCCQLFSELSTVIFRIYPERCVRDRENESQCSENVYNLDALEKLFSIFRDKE